MGLWKNVLLSFPIAGLLLAMGNGGCKNYNCIKGSKVWNYGDESSSESEEEETLGEQLVRSIKEKAPIENIIESIPEDFDVNDPENFFSDEHGDEVGLLHLAIQEGDLDVVKYLGEERGADVNLLTNILNMSPVHTAARCGYRRIWNFLREKGGNIQEVDRRGWNVLHHASAEGFHEIVKEIAELPEGEGRELCRIEDQEQKFLPLHLAAVTGNKDLVERLYEAFSEGIRAKTKRGSTALDIAEAKLEELNREEKICRLLVPKRLVYMPYSRIVRDCLLGGVLLANFFSASGEEVRVLPIPPMHQKATWQGEERESSEEIILSGKADLCEKIGKYKETDNEIETIDLGLANGFSGYDTDRSSN